MYEEGARRDEGPAYLAWLGYPGKFKRRDKVNETIGECTSKYTSRLGGLPTKAYMTKIKANLNSRISVTRRKIVVL